MSALRSRLYAAFRSVSIKWRLQLILAVVALLLLLAFVMMTSSIFSSYQAYLNLSCTRLVSVVSDSLYSGLNSLMSVSKYPVIWTNGSQATDTYLYLSNPHRYSSNILFKDLENQSYYMFEQDRQLRFVSVFDTQGNGYYIKNSTKWEYLVSNDYRNLKFEDPYSQPWFASAADVMGKTVIHRPDEVDLSQIWLPDTEKMLFVSRAVVNIERYEPVGVVLCAVNVSNATQLLEDAVTVSGQQAALFDSTGRIIWGDMPTESVRCFLDNLSPYAPQSGSFVTKEGLSRTMYHYASAPFEGYYFALKTPYSRAVLELFSGRAPLLILLLLCCAAICLFINQVVRSIATPVRNLVESCDNLRAGDFSTTVDDPYRDELSELSGAFNSMSREIEHLIYEVYDKKMEATHNELQLLRSQINPHFLYNTLETIRTKALLDGRHDLSDIAFLLAQILRYGINAPSETVTVETEMQVLRDYIRLQKLLYEDRFVESISVEPYVLQCTILKFLLQPLVENALYHGICTIDGTGTIEILGFVEGEAIVFRVIDDGCGIDEETVHTLNDYINGRNKAFTSLGLKNVNRRVKLTYGEEYGVVVQSRLGQGTMISLTIPLHHNHTDNKEETLPHV